MPLVAIARWDDAAQSSQVALAAPSTTSSNRGGSLLELALVAGTTAQHRSGACIVDGAALSTTRPLAVCTRMQLALGAVAAHPPVPTSGALRTALSPLAAMLTHQRMGAGDAAATTDGRLLDSRSDAAALLVAVPPVPYGLLPTAAAAGSTMHQTRSTPSGAGSLDAVANSAASYLQLRLASLCVASGAPAAAIALVKPLLPTSASAAALLGQRAATQPLQFVSELRLISPPDYGRGVAVGSVDSAALDAPRLLHALHILARAYYRAGQYADAAVLLAQALPHCPLVTFGMSQQDPPHRARVTTSGSGVASGALSGSQEDANGASGPLRVRERVRPLRHHGHSVSSLGGGVGAECVGASDAAAAASGSTESDAFGTCASDDCSRSHTTTPPVLPVALGLALTSAFMCAPDAHGALRLMRPADALAVAAAVGGQDDCAASAASTAPAPEATQSNSQPDGGGRGCLLQSLCIAYRAHAVPLPQSLRISLFWIKLQLHAGHLTVALACVRFLLRQLLPLTAASSGTECGPFAPWLRELHYLHGRLLSEVVRMPSRVVWPLHDGGVAAPPVRGAESTAAAAAVAATAAVVAEAAQLRTVHDAVAAATGAFGEAVRLSSATRDTYAGAKATMRIAEVQLCYRFTHGAPKRGQSAPCAGMTANAGVATASGMRHRHTHAQAPTAHVTVGITGGPPPAAAAGGGFAMGVALETSLLDQHRHRLTSDDECVTASRDDAAGSAAIADAEPQGSDGGGDGGSFMLSSADDRGGGGSARRRESRRSEHDATAQRGVLQEAALQAPAGLTFTLPAPAEGYTQRLLSRLHLGGGHRSAAVTVTLTADDGPPGAAAAVAAAVAPPSLRRHPTAAEGCDSYPELMAPAVTALATAVRLSHPMLILRGHVACAEGALLAGQSEACLQHFTEAKLLFFMLFVDGLDLTLLRSTGDAQLSGRVLGLLMRLTQLLFRMPVSVVSRNLHVVELLLHAQTDDRRRRSHGAIPPPISTLGSAAQASLAASRPGAPPSGPAVPQPSDPCYPFATPPPSGGEASPVPHVFSSFNSDGSVSVPMPSARELQADAERPDGALVHRCPVTAASGRSGETPAMARFSPVLVPALAPSYTLSPLTVLLGRLAGRLAQQQGGPTGSATTRQPAEPAGAEGAPHDTFASSSVSGAAATARLAAAGSDSRGAARLAPGGEAAMEAKPRAATFGGLCDDVAAEPAAGSASEHSLPPLLLGAPESVESDSGATAAAAASSSDSCTSRHYRAAPTDGGGSSEDKDAADRQAALLPVSSPHGTALLVRRSLHPVLHESGERTTVHVPFFQASASPLRSERALSGGGASPLQSGTSSTGSLGGLQQLQQQPVVVRAHPRALSRISVLREGGTRSPPSSILMGGGAHNGFGRDQAQQLPSPRPVAAGSAQLPFPAHAQHLPLLRQAAMPWIAPVATSTATARADEEAVGATAAAGAALEGERGSQEAAVVVRIMAQLRVIRGHARAYGVTGARSETHAAGVRAAMRSACQRIARDMGDLRHATPLAQCAYDVPFDAMLATASQLALSGVWAGAVPATQALQRLVYALVLDGCVIVYAPFAGALHVSRLGGEQLVCFEPPPPPPTEGGGAGDAADAAAPGERRRAAQQQQPPPQQLPLREGQQLGAGALTDTPLRAHLARTVADVMVGVGGRGGRGEPASPTTELHAAAAGACHLGGGGGSGAEGLAAAAPRGAPAAPVMAGAAGASAGALGGSADPLAQAAADALTRRTAYRLLGGAHRVVRALLQALTASGLPAASYAEPAALMAHAAAVAAQKHTLSSRLLPAWLRPALPPPPQPLPTPPLVLVTNPQAALLPWEEVLAVTRVALGGVAPADAALALSRQFDAALAAAAAGGGEAPVTAPPAGAGGDGGQQPAAPAPPRAPSALDALHARVHISRATSLSALLAAPPPRVLAPLPSYVAPCSSAPGTARHLRALAYVQDVRRRAALARGLRELDPSLPRPATTPARLCLDSPLLPVLLGGSAVFGPLLAGGASGGGAVPGAATTMRAAALVASVTAGAAPPGAPAAVTLLRLLRPGGALDTASAAHHSHRPPHLSALDTAPSAPAPAPAPRGRHALGSSSAEAAARPPPPATPPPTGGPREPCSGGGGGGGGGGGARDPLPALPPLHLCSASSPPPLRASTARLRATTLLRSGGGSSSGGGGSRGSRSTEGGGWGAEPRVPAPARGGEEEGGGGASSSGGAPPRHHASRQRPPAFHAPRRDLSGTAAAAAAASAAPSAASTGDPDVTRDLAAALAEVRASLRAAAGLPAALALPQSAPAALLPDEFAYRQWLSATANPPLTHPVASMRKTPAALRAKYPAIAFHDVGALVGRPDALVDWVRGVAAADGGGGGAAATVAAEGGDSEQALYDHLAEAAAAAAAVASSSAVGADASDSLPPQPRRTTRRAAPPPLLVRHGGVPGLLPSTWHVLLLQLGDLAEAGEGVTRLLTLCPHVTVLFVPGPPAIVKLTARFLCEGWETAQRHLLQQHAGRRAGRLPRAPGAEAAAAPPAGASGSAPTTTGPPPAPPLPTPPQPTPLLPRAIQRGMRHPAVAATVAGYARSAGRAADLEAQGAGPAALLPPEWATPRRFLLSTLASLRDKYGVTVVVFNAPA